MTFFEAILLGIIEGVTEFLPISSTGHLILASHVLGIPSTEFVKSFKIAIQLGAILAVVALYAKSLLLDTQTIRRVLVAFVPTSIVGLLLYKTIKQFLLGSSDVVLWALFLGGIFLLLFERRRVQQSVVISEMCGLSYRQAFLVGLAQSVSVVPGVSRAAATIIGGLLIGMERKTAVEFSFILAVPTMAAATSLDLVKTAGVFSAADMATLAVGFIVSFVVAIVTMRWLLRFIKTHSFAPFGIYRIVLAVLFWSAMR